jgi:hypothetical protein
MTKLPPPKAVTLACPHRAVRHRSLGNPVVYRVDRGKDVRTISIKTPGYRLHRPSGRAVVTLSGRDFDLGKFDSPESRAEYDRLVAEWLLNGRGKPEGSKAADLSGGEILLAFHDGDIQGLEGESLEVFDRPRRQSARQAQDTAEQVLIAQRDDAGIAAFRYPDLVFVAGTLAVGRDAGHHPNALTVVPAEKAVD